MIEDPEMVWSRLDNEGGPKKKEKKSKKIKWDNPLQEKYQELNTRYGDDFGKDTGTIECQDLLEDLYAFKRVFRIMKWKDKPNG